MNDIKITLDFDKDTANRLLNEAFDIITEIKEILEDEAMSNKEALQNIDYELRHGREVLQKIDYVLRKAK